MVIPPMELSAEWMMSDFEHNIQLSWVSIFPDVEAKGCHFHYAKVCTEIILKKHFIKSNRLYFQCKSMKLRKIKTSWG